MKDPLTITQVLCTRLCHDLAGPIGAVAAGVELAGDDPSQVDAETLQLLANSAAAATRKLKFLRVALGSAGAQTPAKDFQATVTHYFDAIAGPSGPARVEWPADTEFAQAAAAAHGQGAQILANLILVAAEVVPRLRSVVVRVLPSDGAVTLSAEARGDISANLDPRPELVKVLSVPDAAAVTPKSVQALYAHAIVTQAGGSVSGVATEGGFQARATLPRPG
jgi:histidine phosphotransferase ChpT